MLHYTVGQKYEVRTSVPRHTARALCRAQAADAGWLRTQAHYDYFHDQLNVQNGGQRVATVLLYLRAPARIAGRSAFV